MKEFIYGFLITSTIVLFFLLVSSTKESTGYKGVKVEIFERDYYQRQRIANFIYKESKKGYVVQGITSLTLSTSSSSRTSSDIMIILTK